MSDLLVIKAGKQISLKDHGFEVDDVIVKSGDMTHVYKSIEGLSGRSHQSSTMEYSTIEVPVRFNVLHDLDIPILRDKLTAILTSTNPFYIRERRQKIATITPELPGQTTGELVENPEEDADGKQYKVLRVGLSEPVYDNGSWVMTASFETAGLPFGESVGTTLDLHATGVKDTGLWSVGMGLTDNPQDWVYAYENVTETPIYNAGDVPINLLSMKRRIQISVMEETDKFILTDGIGQEIIVSTPIKVGDVLVFDGPKVSLNGRNILTKVNFKYPVIKSGHNTFKFSCLVNVNFDFKFYYGMTTEYFEEQAFFPTTFLNEGYYNLRDKEKIAKEEVPAIEQIEELPEYQPDPLFEKEELYDLSGYLGGGGEDDRAGGNSTGRLGEPTISPLIPIENDRPLIDFGKEGTTGLGIADYAPLNGNSQSFKPQKFKQSKGFGAKSGFSPLSDFGYKPLNNFNGVSSPIGLDSGSFASKSASDYYKDGVVEGLAGHPYSVYEPPIVAPIDADNRFVKIKWSDHYHQYNVGIQVFNTKDELVWTEVLKDVHYARDDAPSSANITEVGYLRNGDVGYIQCGYLQEDFTVKVYYFAPGTAFDEPQSPYRVLKVNAGSGIQTDYFKHARVIEKMNYKNLWIGTDKGYKTYTGEVKISDNFYLKSSTSDPFRVHTVGDAFEIRLSTPGQKVHWGFKGLKPNQWYAFKFDTKIDSYSSALQYTPFCNIGGVVRPYSDDKNSYQYKQLRIRDYNELKDGEYSGLGFGGDTCVMETYCITFKTNGNGEGGYFNELKVRQLQSFYWLNYGVENASYNYNSDIVQTFIDPNGTGQDTRLRLPDGFYIPAGFKNVTLVDMSYYMDNKVSWDELPTKPYYYASDKYKYNEVGANADPLSSRYSGVHPLEEFYGRPEEEYYVRVLGRGAPKMPVYFPYVPSKRGK